MIELSIPQPGEETKNAKDLIFSILTQESPLSTIELYNQIKKKYSVSLTYQAVKKALNVLETKKVVVKRGKYYELNKDWLLRLKVELDSLLSAYDNQKKHPVVEKLDQEYATYTFTTLLELDNFWDDMLIHICNKLESNEPQMFLAHAHYGWWLLINLGRETQLFNHFLECGLDIYNLFVGKHPLNEWAYNIYGNMGVHFKVIEDESINANVTLNVIGNTVIQVYYPPKILELLEQFYTKYKSVQEMSITEITRLAHTSCELRMTVFKNKDIADSLYQKYKAKF